MNSKQFVKCIAKRSKLISILLKTEDPTLEKLIDETAKLTWSMAYYESIHSTLNELEIDERKDETESAEDANYFDIRRGVGSVEALEWALMTSLLEQVGADRLKQAIHKLAEDERAEIKKKLVEARDSYGSGESRLHHIVQVLNKTIRVIDNL